MNIQIKQLTDNDTDQFKELIHLFRDVFEMPETIIPEGEYITQLLAKQNFFAFVALVDNEIVGGLTTYSLQQYCSVLPIMLIYDLAIKPEMQRKGIGRRLISTVKAYCMENGFEEMFILADEVDEHALEFYRSTGGSESRVVQFNYKFK